MADLILVATYIFFIFIGYHTWGYRRGHIHGTVSHVNESIRKGLKTDD